MLFISRKSCVKKTWDSNLTSATYQHSWRQLSGKEITQICLMTRKAWGSVSASVKQDNETCLWGCGKGPCQGQAAREGWATGLTVMPVLKPSASIPYSQLSVVPITSPLSPPWLWCSWGEFCLCSPVLFVCLSPPQPSPHWCPRQLRRWRWGHTEDPPGRCGGPRSAAHWRSAHSSRWSACREPPGPPAPPPAGWFCWEAMASICHRACCWRGTCLSQPRHTAAPSSLRPCQSVQTWDWPHQLLGFRLWIQEEEHNWSWAGPQPSIHHTNKGMSRWVRVRAVWLWIRPLWSLVPGLLIWNKEWSTIICCDFLTYRSWPYTPCDTPVALLIVQIQALSTPTSLGE